MHRSRSDRLSFAAAVCGAGDWWLVLGGRGGARRALGGGRGACMCDWRARRGVPGERGAWRARADRAAAASARAPPAPCERRRVYGYLRELPAPRAKGTREAVGARRGRAR